MWSDPVVMRSFGDVRLKREVVWRKVLTYVGHWALFGFGYWAVVDKSTGLFVGEVGLAYCKRALPPTVADLPEAGWVLTSPAHGRGLATEAMQAALAWADTHVDAAQTSCIIDPTNAPSLRVAKKLGYRLHDRVPYDGDDTFIYVRDSPPQQEP